MAKKTVIFNTDFASKKKGESFTCDPSLANQLVEIDKVADYEGQSSKLKRKDKHEENMEE